MLPRPSPTYDSFQSISTTIEITDLQLNVSQRIAVLAANIKVNSFQQDLWRETQTFRLWTSEFFGPTFLEHVGVCQAPKHANGAAAIPPGDTPPLKWFCNSWVCNVAMVLTYKVLVPLCASLLSRKSCHKEYQRPQCWRCLVTNQWDFPRCSYIFHIFSSLGVGILPWSEAPMLPEASPLGGLSCPLGPGASPTLTTPQCNGSNISPKGWLLILEFLCWFLRMFTNKISR